MVKSFGCSSKDLSLAPNTQVWQLPTACTTPAPGDPTEVLFWPLRTPALIYSYPWGPRHIRKSKESQSLKMLVKELMNRAGVQEP